MRHISRWSNIHRVHRHTGFRSGLEVAIAAQLDQLSVVYGYEADSIPYTFPAEERTYTPDFKLPNGVIIETKGEFTSKDRKKHLLIKEQHPELDIRFVFSNPNQRIGKKSATTYGMWCLKHGFQYASKSIPSEWLREHHCQIEGE